MNPSRWLVRTCAVATTVVATTLAGAAEHLAESDPSAAVRSEAVGDPPITDQEKAAAAASNAFGIDLYKAIAKATPTSNLFISPYSMALALTMTAEGATGETEAEMLRMLHVPARAESAGRSLTEMHVGHLGLAQRLRAGGGQGDAATRARIEALRAQLAAANSKAATQQTDQKWSEAAETAAEARRLADELNALLTTVDRFDLRIANALWVEQTFPLLSSYVQAIDQHYGVGGATSLDIAGQPEQARSRINAWVEAQTANRIVDLVPPGALLPTTRLVVTNAVYFKGEWTDPFPESGTREEEFTLADGAKVRTMMMRDRRRSAISYAAFSGDGAFFPTPHEVPREPVAAPKTYPDDDGFVAVEATYKGGQLAMTVIAPRSAQGLAALEARLTGEALEGWLDRLEQRTVDVALPRFRMSSAHEMSRPLQAMGMRRAFVNPALPDGAQAGAQFGGMSASVDPAQQLFVGGILHKAWIDVTERGTEAAAATAVMMAPGGIARPPEMVPFIPQFRADHPFLLLIRDTRSGVILFIGRMTTPSR